MRYKPQETFRFKKKYVICDIDGTIADCTHRLTYIEGKHKDWDSFYSKCSFDSPIYNVIRVVQALRDEGRIIIFVTGRSEQAEAETIAWVLKYFGEFDYMLMRKIGDHRKDYIIKPELLADAKIKPHQILCAFEDRMGVVETYRKLGITTLQVADGDF